MFDHDYANYPELTNSQLEVLGFSSPHPQITEDFRAVVERVHDGDTVSLRAGFRDFVFPLRLADIDAPELNAGGETARDWLRAKVEGREVTVLVDPSNRVDKYGRLLGSLLFLGLELGEEMVHLGLVVPFGSRLEGVVRDVAYYVPEVSA
jgi:endonuclease YncB( thermonuclease family)